MLVRGSDDQDLAASVFVRCEVEIWGLTGAHLQVGLLFLVSHLLVTDTWVHTTL